MSPDELDSEAYARSLGEGIRVGDICQAVGVPDLTEPGLFRTDEEPDRPLLAGRFIYALVVSVYEGYATVVPLMVAEGVGDEEAFAALIRTGEDARRWMLVPPLEGYWDEDALALFFMAHTLHQESLLDRRVARMHPPARETVARRFARAFSDDDN